MMDLRRQQLHSNSIHKTTIAKTTHLLVSKAQLKYINLFYGLNLTGISVEAYLLQVHITAFAAIKKNTQNSRKHNVSTATEGHTRSVGKTEKWKGKSCAPMHQADNHLHLQS